MFWQDPTYNRNSIPLLRLQTTLCAFDPSFELDMFESSRQSVDGEDAGKRIFAHLFEEDIKKQAIVKSDVKKVTVVLGFSPHVFETALAKQSAYSDRG